MSYIHHIFGFIIFPFYAQYYQRFIYIFSKIYSSHLVIIYISDNSFSKKGNEISPTPFVISYLFTIPLHLHPLIPPRHWAFPVSLQPHSGVYTNAKGQISSSLVLLDSPFSVADC